MVLVAYAGPVSHAAWYVYVSECVHRLHTQKKHTHTHAHTHTPLESYLSLCRSKHTHTHTHTHETHTHTHTGDAGACCSQCSANAVLTSSFAARSTGVRRCLSLSNGSAPRSSSFATVLASPWVLATCNGERIVGPSGSLHL